LVLGLPLRIAVVSAVASLHAIVLAGSLLIGSETVAPPNVLGVDVVSRGEMALATGSAPTPENPVLTPPVAEPPAEAALAQRRQAAQDDRPKAPPAPESDDPDKNLPQAQETPAPQQAQAPQAPQPAQAAATAIGAEESAEAVSLSSRRLYAAMVSAEINRRKFYPTGARGTGDGGAAEVTFEIGPGGSLSRQEVTTSSGNGLLDEAARKMVASAVFPPPPGGRFLGKIRITFRIHAHK
jgi:periplasmic protein TonB